jgi:putative toxin-antitoxin system antitoxin component (TIGR02293 family)
MAHIERDKWVLANWDTVSGAGELRSEFSRKSSWVIHSPRSPAVWYSTLFGNLMRDFPDVDPVTMNFVVDNLDIGLDRSAFDRFKYLVAISSEDLGKAMGVTMSTLARREKFKPDESERLFRVASVFQRVLEVFADIEKSQRWFKSPKRVLGDNTPLEYCHSEIGAEEVRNLLGRIEHGVFS